MTDTAAASPLSGVISALRRLGGRATLGDVVSATGLPEHEAETSLKSLLETRRGHLAVSDSGDLLYRFDRKLISRDAEPFGVRFRRAAWSAFKVGFKIWTAAMLVVYFVVFVALLLAAMFARQGDRDGGFGGRGGFGLGDFFILHWLLGGRGWSRGSLYYGDAHARRLPKDAQPPFYKKVFAFIFGPEEPRPTQQQKDRTVLQLIRARNGVLTTPELVEHTALPLHEADQEMGRLTGAYGGDPRVSERGEVVYAFPGLMKSAHGKVRAREPKPAWLRLERPRKLTGNPTGSNLVIGGMNGFNLVMAGAVGLAPAFEAASQALPPLSPLVVIGLGVVPATFSTLFYAIPLLRSLGLRRENNARSRRNVRRLLVGLVYARSVAGVRWISVADAVRHVTGAVKGQRVDPAVVRRELETLAAEFDAEVAAAPEAVKGPDAKALVVQGSAGGLQYRFPAIRETFVDAELTRRRLRLRDQKLGAIVYDTADTALEESQRDLEALDRELRADAPSPELAELDLSRYLPSPGRVGYEEDFEVVLGPSRARTGRSRPGRPPGRPQRGRPGSRRPPSHSRWR